MKKRLVALVLALALVVPFAALADETYYQPGNLVPSIGVGAGFGWGFTVSAYPGLELMVAKWKIADVIPLDFGVAVKGLLGFSTGYFGSSYTHLGVGAFGTVHWGLRGMSWDLNFLDPVDLWWGIGIAASAHLPADTWTYGWLNFATVGGVNYFLNDRFALMLAGSYWGYGGGYVGVLYKLGKGEKLIKKEG
jgi:hypothetical protein